jgi:hypothetical protein
VWDEASAGDRGRGAAGELGCGQDAGQEPDTEPRPFDECGVLMQVGNCVLFAGAGGNYYLPDAGDYRVGDAVRVVGTLYPNCSTICTEADGCISGAAVYDPAVFPCGTDLPNFPGDLLAGLCTAVGTGLLACSAIGTFTRGRTELTTKIPRHHAG